MTVFSFDIEKNGHGCRVEPSDSTDSVKLKTLDVPAALERPEQVEKGLTSMKQTDLHLKILHFVPDEYKDILCPTPPLVLCS